MEKSNNTDASTRIRDLTPPKSADASMVLNGAGNGMMLGGIPFLISQLYSRIGKKKLSPSLEIASEFAVVAGAAIGAVYGAKEAKDLRRYRESLRNEIADLRAQGDANSAKLDGWADKEQARPLTQTEPSR